MADQESKIKELIQLLNTHYNNVRGGDDTTTSRADITTFLETNKDMNQTSDALWEIIGNVYARGTPQGNPVDFFYEKFKTKKGGKGRSNRKRRHASKGKGRSRRHRRNQRRTRARRGGNMFHGSNATPPVVCLAGNSKIPCTKFTTA